MKKILRKLAITILTFFIGGITCVQAGPGRLLAMYIGPITSNNGNGPHSYGVPDSLAYTYSGNRAVPDLVTFYVLDTVAHTSTVMAYDIYTYTPADSFLTDITQTVNNGVATNSTRLSRAYDAAGNDTLILNETWNTATASWVGNSRTIFTFNTANQRTAVVLQSWNSTAGTWNNLIRNTYQYDAAGRDSVNLQQKWAAAISNWKNVTLNTTQYTSFNKIAAVSHKRWSDTTSVWKDSSSLINHYNSSNYLTSTVSGPYYYNNQPGSIDSLVTLTFSAAGSPTMQIAYEKAFPLATNTYIPEFRYTYSYNAANQILSNQTELIDNMYVAYNSLTGYNNYNSNGQITQEEPVSTNATNYILTKEQYKFYYEVAAGVSSSPVVSNNGITVYPSPATSVVTLSLNTDWQGDISVALTDVTGRIWQQWSEPAKGGYTRQISVAELPAGLYYFRMSDGSRVASRTVIVRH